MTERPEHLDLDRARGLTVRWTDGRTTFFSVATLRRLSPSAEARELRRSMESNPLTILPSTSVSSESIRAESAELVGNYAIRITFSDGHDTGIYSWSYLRELDAAGESSTPPGGDDAGAAS